jgi:hypothetical protein
MGTFVAAAVFAPMVGAVTAYNAWAVYRVLRRRYFAYGEGGLAARAQAAAGR